MVRLFVAAWLPADVSDHLAGIDRPIERGVRWMAPESWHITLRFIGDADSDEVHGRLTAATLPRVRVDLGPKVELLGLHQIVIPVAGAESLAAAVRSATTGIGVDEQRTFRGHLTIARLQPGAHSSIDGSPVSARFDIDEIALVASDLGSQGAVYTTVARYSTVPSADDQS